MRNVSTFTRPALLVAGCLVASLLAAVPVTPASADASLAQGDALPWRYETTLRYFALAGSSAGYLMHTRTQYDEDHGRTYSVVRVSDGAVATTFERPYNVPGNEEPQLVDHSYVEMTTRSGTSYGPDHVDVHDVVTGSTTTIDLTSHDGYLHGDDAWALVTDSGATTSERTLTFVRGDGHAVESSLVAGADVAWVGGDSTTAYVTSENRSYALDPETGAATELTLPDGSPLHLWAVTTDTLVGRTDTYVDGRSADHFTTVSRGTGEVLAQTDVVRDYRTRRYLPYGDGLAALSLPDGGSSTLPDGAVIYRYQVRPVDPATGALLPAVATDVVDADPMGDGEIALTLGDVPAGRLAVLSGDGTARPVADLPRIGYGSLDVGLSDGTAVTSLQGQTGLWATPADGTGAWQPTYPDSTPEDVRRGDFTLGGDTVLTRLPSSRSWDPGHYRLAWPGGSRDLDAAGTPRLGSDGRYVVRRVPGSTPQWEVQQVRTGTVVTSWTDAADRYLDGHWLWTGPDADGSMTGADLTGAEPDRAASLPLDCSGKPASVSAIRGRWALTNCDAYEVVDLWGVVKPWEVPANRGYVALGDGYVAWVDVSDATPPVISLKVADLSTDHTVHTYGPLRGQSYPPGPDFAVDTADNPDLVYVDTSYRVRHVHLDWLGQAPLVRADGTPPALVSEPSLTPAVRSSDPVTVSPSWTYAEPDVPHEPQSGTDSYDVRYQDYPSPSGTDWTEPAGWSHLTTAAVTVTLRPGEGRCFQARARDKAGNTSAWSTPACSYVDDAAPVLGRAGGTRRLVPKVLSTVTYRFGATDDDAVASYDVAVRHARRGKPLSPWRTRWAQTQRTAVSVDGRPGTEHCFRFRARDRAGNTSRWSPARCSALPVDDSAFTTRGPVTSGNLDIAIVGTYTGLDRRGASATLRSQTGRTVALWAIEGPYQGRVDVYAGGRYLGRASLKAPWQRRGVVTFHSRRPWSGKVRVVAASRRPVRLDAIAVLR